MHLLLRYRVKAVRKRGEECGRLGERNIAQDVRKVGEKTGEQVRNEVTTINYNLLVSKNVGVGYIIRRVELADHMRILERGKKKYDQEDW